MYWDWIQKGAQSEIQPKLLTKLKFGKEKKIKD